MSVKIVHRFDDICTTETISNAFYIRHYLVTMEVSPEPENHDKFFSGPSFPANISISQTLLKQRHSDVTRSKKNEPHPLITPFPPPPPPLSVQPLSIETQFFCYQNYMSCGIFDLQTTWIHTYMIHNLPASPLPLILHT